MKGRRSVFARMRELEEVRARRPNSHRKRYDFSMFTDEEVEELMALADRAEVAGGEPVWTPEEWVVIERLNAKLAAAAEGPQ